MVAWSSGCQKGQLYAKCKWMSYKVKVFYDVLVPAVSK